jgi:hypothetical protein
MNAFWRTGLAERIVSQWQAGPPSKGEFKGTALKKNPATHIAGGILSNLYL